MPKFIDSFNAIALHPLWVSDCQIENEDLPLQGLRVLDLSQGIAGPYCGLVLAQQGAQVIKVEPPEGDWSRHMGRQQDGMSAIFLSCNSGKKGLCINARTPEGKQQLLELAAQADVVIQNYRPGVAERMGVGWEALSQRNPGLVYISITGWGNSGPMAKVPTLDTTMQAASGMMHANRSADGQPRRVGLYVIDLTTGLYAAQAGMAALLRQARTGLGRHVHVSMLQAAAALQNYLVVDAVLYPGSESAVNAPTGIFTTADDKPLYISMLNDAMFERLAQAMGLTDWQQDHSLQTSSGRLPRAQELVAQLQACVGQDSLAHWSEVLAKHDILFAAVRTPVDLLSDLQSQHVQLYAQQMVDGVGTIPLVALPGGSGSAVLAAAPRLGQHNTQL